jgi:hypothetical protein
MTRKFDALAILSKYPHTVDGLHAAVGSEEWQSHPLLAGATVEGALVEVCVSSDDPTMAVWPMDRSLTDPPDLVR